jgi:hypothetical protein
MLQRMLNNRERLPDAAAWQLRALHDRGISVEGTFSALEADLAVRHHDADLPRTRVTLPYRDEPLHCNSEVEYGRQPHSTHGVLFYVRFTDLLVLDVDELGLEPKVLEERLAALNMLEGFRWAACPTPGGGWHLYLISHLVPFNSNESIQLMFQFPGSDPWYARYALHNGFKVRVSHKPEESAGSPLWLGAVYLGSGRASLVQERRLCLLQTLKEHHAQMGTVPYSAWPPTDKFEGDSFFATSFLQDVLQSNDPEVVGMELWPYRRHALQFLLQHTPDDPLVPVLQRLTMRRPQRLVFDGPRHYVAHDLFTNTWYVCFKHLLMLDLDDQDARPSLTALAATHYFEEHATRKGRHVFLLSESHVYKSKQAAQFMQAHGCDTVYASYAQIRGWSVRLNRKQDEPEGSSIYTNKQRWGEATPDAALIKDIDNLNALVAQYMNETPSRMR